MRQKFFVLSVLVLAFALLFSACTPELSLEPETAESGEVDDTSPDEVDEVQESQPEPATGLSGQIQVAGSTTVQPLSEKLALAFMALNPDLVIEVQGGGSSVGVTAAGEGTVDIGQVSREIKASEFEAFSDLQVHTIAFDGIAIVTHPDLELPPITLEEVKRIFAGEITNYADIGGPDAEIIVVSREEGSGTRAAFDELVLEYSEPEMEMSETALLQQSNGQVRTTVATTPDAIGYLSFGFLDESINLVAVNGFQPTVDNVLAGNYPVFRPLNLTTLGDPNDLSQAFIDFILSDAGQKLVAEDYIPAKSDDVVSVPEPKPSLSGQIQVAGSTTVQPLSEKLALAFMALNPDLVIEVQGGGSSVGVTAAGEGTVDIGQVSREIKGSEFEAFPDLQVHTIAYDGIAIVTHPDLELPSLTLDEAKRIFAGEITNYAEIGGPDAEIIVVSREEGSGTRAAFDELVLEFGEPKMEMAETALLQQSNGQVRTTVATTPDAIGYLSFGFLDESINLVAVNGFQPTVDNVLAGNYPVFRPLNLTTLGDPNELAQAFLVFILGEEGQSIVSDDYIPAVGEDASYVPVTGLIGQIQVAGSTTVQPLSEKLALAFMAYNTDLVIEVQGGGSSVGVTAAGEGTVDIGQVSREVKGSEFEAFPDLQVHTIAYDGIAIVTHPDLELPSITLDEAKRIFAGEITNYAEIGGPDAEIIVVSREEGSGTRAAFDELVLEFGEPKMEMADTALLQQSNGQVRTTVATTPNAIGYLSFGFLDDSTNLVEIDGYLPTVENVLAGSYPVFRPLNLTTLGDPNELSQAFLDFILSRFGQEIVAQDYIPVR